MPIVYEIQPANHAVLLRYSGRVTDAELLATYVRVYTDPGYRPGFRELADCREVTAFDVSVDAIRSSGEMAVVAAGSPPVPSRVAIVAPRDAVYGLARLYQMVQEPTTEEVGVFREIVEAQRWLGLDEVPGRGAPPASGS